MKIGQIVRCIERPINFQIEGAPEKGKCYPIMRLGQLGSLVISDKLNDDGLMTAWRKELFVVEKPVSDKFGVHCLGLIEYGQCTNFKG